MRIAFTTPELRRLDTVKSNAICLCLFEDDWPLKGTPGLVDWRVSGHLSRLADSGWISSTRGEVVLMPLAGRLPFERLLLVGMGPGKDGVDEDRVARGLHRMFESLAGLRVHAAVVHLPGRPSLWPADRAVRVLLEVAEDHPDHDEVVLVEPIDAQRTMKGVIDGRRA